MAGTQMHQLSADINSDNTDSSHFARLIFLINEEGADRIRQFVLDNLQRGATLESQLQTKINHFQKLKARNIITESHLNLLYPLPGHQIEQSEIDISLWYCLARNLPRKSRQFNWGYYERNPPSPAENSPQHDIVRLRNTRNQLAHFTTPCIGSARYNQIWSEVSFALQRLGTSRATIDDYQMRDLDPIRTIKLYLKMKEEALKDTECLYKREMGKKRYMLAGFGILVLVMLAAMGVLSYVMFTYGKTFQSCATHIQILPLDGDKGAVSYLDRKGWGAAKPTYVDPPPRQPADYVIISHTAEIGGCLTSDACCNAVRNVQKFNMEYGFPDIAFNFLVGNDAVVYEGHGWNSRGTAAAGWNTNAISVAFIGKYIASPPKADALDAGKQFLQYMAYQGVLTRNFTLYGLCQVRDAFPDAPGKALYDILKTWKSETPGYYWSWRPRDGSVCPGD